MKNILVVEPNKTVAEIIKEYLEKDNRMHVRTAHDAQSAIHLVDEVKPDVVILELAIPMHNGFAFLHEFRSYSDWKNIPIIIHSHLARTEAEMSKSWKNLGASHYLYKPRTSLAELKAAAEETCGL